MNSGGFSLFPFEGAVNDSLIFSDFVHWPRIGMFSKHISNQFIYNFLFTKKPFSQFLISQMVLMTCKCEFPRGGLDDQKPNRYLFRFFMSDFKKRGLPDAVRHQNFVHQLGNQFGDPRLCEAHQGQKLVFNYQSDQLSNLLK